MKMSLRFPQAGAGLVALSLLLAPPSAQAIPLLQLYIEGATYDSTSETWVANFSSSDTLRLWAIGNVTGPGSKGSIFDVKLALAYDVADSPTITLTPSATGGYGGFTDPSTPGAATFIQTKTDGSVPKLGDGSNLASHGEYGAGTAWSEYGLGNFTLSDSPSGDFISSFPTPGANGFQINVYDITITGTDSVHFDLYDHYQSKQGAKVVNKYVFAPFSHDAEGERKVPDGGTTLIMLAFSLFAVQGVARKLRNA
jgi:VPDSG-CTERM motif